METSQVTQRSCWPVDEDWRANPSIASVTERAFRDHLACLLPLLIPRRPSPSLVVTPFSSSRERILSSAMAFFLSPARCLPSVSKLNLLPCGHREQTIMVCFYTTERLLWCFLVLASAPGQISRLPLKHQDRLRNKPVKKGAAALEFLHCQCRWLFFVRPWLDVSSSTDSPSPWGTSLCRE